VLLAVSLSLAMCCVASCHRSVHVTLVGCARATAEPATGAVHPGPYPLDPVRGDLAVLFVSTDRPLEALTRFTYAHGFVLLACSGDDRPRGLWSGQIHAATPAECGAPVGSANLYKVYVPLDRDRLRDRATSWQGSGEAVLRLAAARGVCVRIGGGQMWWTHSLSSNEVPVPIVVADGSVTLAVR
jgi:hypothetical protein